MRKVILSVNITMNGFMAGINGELDWHYDYWSDEMAEVSRKLLHRVDTIVAGRITYQAMIAHWGQVAVSPMATPADRNYARTLCVLPKIVFSTTLKEANRYQSRLAKAGLKEEIMTLKRQPGKDIISWGGVNMAHSLINAGVVDIYLLWVAPIMLNQGVPLFTNPQNRPRSRPVKVTSFSNGVVLYDYRSRIKNHKL